ncbi:MAG: hypothetical protein E2O66_07595 [Deltaproteobacteria bacterium]|nr:MAG: hypothetical protein E2O66_07595 [Deltaproteobacteria bacterium]
MAGAASAAPLNWVGTSTLLLGDFEPTAIPGGGVATVNGSSGVIPAHLSTLRLAASRGNVATDFTLIVTDPVATIKLIQFFDVQAGTGTFGPGISGAVGTATQPGKNLGTLPLGGVVKLCVIDTSCNFSFSLILSTPTVNGIAAVGVGGQIGGGSLLVGVSVQGAPWTVKTVTLIDEVTSTVGTNKTFIPVTFKGFAHGPNSMTTSNTAAVSGVLQLVTPSQVVTTLLDGSNAKIASGNIFLLKFIPEPGLLLLLGSGVIGLVVLGRTRMHK